MSITDNGFTLSAYGAGWSVPPVSPATVAVELVTCLVHGPTKTATVFHGSDSASVTRHLDGWVVANAQAIRPWHHELQRLLRITEENNEHGHTNDRKGR